MYGAMTFTNRGRRLSEPESLRGLLVRGADWSVLEADPGGTGITNSFGANDSERAGLVTGRGSSIVGITKELGTTVFGFARGIRVAGDFGVACICSCGKSVGTGITKDPPALAAS